MALHTGRSVLLYYSKLGLGFSSENLESLKVKWNNISRMFSQYLENSNVIISLIILILQEEI
jgi:hypothetical protein